MEIRIIKRINLDKTIDYIIQKKLFWWWYKCSLCIGTCHGSFQKDCFDSLEEAQKNLCYFDGSKCKEKVVHNG